MNVSPAFVSTTLEIPGFRIVECLGVAQGLTVRSRSIIGNIGAMLQSLFGGNITLYSELCEAAREEAFLLLRQQAGILGANAIIGMRFDANEIAAGITEVLAYGTAVVIVPLNSTETLQKPTEKPSMGHGNQGQTPTVN